MEASAGPPPSRAEPPHRRRHRGAVWSLIVLASVVLVVSIIANWVQSQLLDSNQVKSTTDQILALIEKRFLSTGGDRPYLTARDQHASTVEDLFDFEHAPSMDAPLPTTLNPPGLDHGCPFVP